MPDSVLGNQVLPRLEDLADLLVRFLVSLGSALVMESPALEGSELVGIAALTDAPALHRTSFGLTLAEAEWNLFKPIYFAASMVEAGDVDAMVAGIEANYGEILRPALQIVGPAEDAKRAAGLYMLAFPNRELLFFADTTVNIDPDAETLRDIALQTAAFVRELGIRPRVAMVSFSNFGSATHDESTRMSDAVDLVRAADPDLEIDGEMQADTAVDPIKLRDP